MSTLNSYQGQLNDAIRNVYAKAGIQITHPVRPEAESLEYGACHFDLDGHSVAYRVARTTPTKIGKFVTIWKRSTPDSEITPLDITDDVQFVVIGVADGVHRGQFIFNQKILLAKNIMSSNGKGGKSHSSVSAMEYSNGERCNTNTTMADATFSATCSRWHR